MMNDSADLPFGGSKTVDGSAEPASYDELNFWEPHEANPRNEDEEKRSGGETGHDDGEPNGIDADGDEPTLSDEEEAANEAEDMIVTLEGGEQVPLEELKLGYMRERDYRHKKQDLANRGRALESMSSRVVATAKAVAELVAGQIPDEPSEELRLSDPEAYQRQRALRQAGLEQLARMMALADEPAGVVAELQSAAAEERLAAENAKLLEAFPQTRDDEGRQAFFAEAFETARELGFSEPEMREVIDHRLFKLAHYARLGLNAERARLKALQKVTEAPAPTPRVKAKSQAQRQNRESREAMRRLTRSGSIRDAMAVDFE
ncbi:pyruvate/2-oxoglutarate dehydrogenase complex dihydrolipoamide acyltransferase (E2) component [Sinorhizobium kostiense]|uniref:Pyruvate/2-oxoglutarate dehydrogenase complex dihydrolipoamide acyltransferase (E2) component n=1 Tax=Sinorhizobium kostiense TaxID=76747 RepID=A0ABS4R2I7_9HYPH|nr:hypothetical protein [Sinorhizobium kostiense]MBP2237123.1 pyruvate/2-oxoglutarate dehydrogenase complex dihydrolipoamide acyltransferase (E2) component [Sinorhizobium kostiense]